MHNIPKYFQLRFSKNNQPIYLEVLYKWDVLQPSNPLKTTNNGRISVGNYYLSNNVSSQNLRLQHTKYQQFQQSKSSPKHDDVEVKNYFSQILISEIKEEKQNISSPPCTPFDLLNKMQQQQTDDNMQDPKEQCRISLKDLNKFQNFYEVGISSFEL